MIFCFRGDALCILFVRAFLRVVVGGLRIAVCSEDRVYLRRYGLAAQADGA